MTDPVDPDALRAFALRYATTIGATSALTKAVPDHLNAAADEVDRLRAVITANRRLSDDERNARATARTAMMVDYVPAEKLSRLRTAIENAPHDDKCVHARFIAAGWTPQGRCTCWKADALL